MNFQGAMLVFRIYMSLLISRSMLYLYWLGINHKHLSALGIMFNLMCIRDHALGMVCWQFKYSDDSECTNVYLQIDCQARLIPALLIYHIRSGYSSQ